MIELKCCLSKRELCGSLLSKDKEIIKLKENLADLNEKLQKEN